METDLKPLTDVMTRLLAEDGCPWDKAQTHETLRRYILEETHEVIEAIDNKDMENLKEELGDVLLQIVFHAKLAEKDGDFTMQDVVDTESEKMIRRHPHIFGDIKVNSAEDVAANWEEIKKREKAAKGETEASKSIMSGLPPTLPALMKAEKVQKKARRVGFDFDNIEETKEKLLEELHEVEEALKGNGDIEDEVGDLLFSAVNYARFAKVDPEQALNHSTNKFVNRFKSMERKIMLDKKEFDNYTVEELNILWDAAKSEETLK